MGCVHSPPYLSFGSSARSPRWRILAAWPPTAVTMIGRMGVGTVIVLPGDRRHLPIDRNERWEERSISPIVPRQEPLELRRFEAEIQAMLAISTAMATALAANRRF